MDKTKNEIDPLASHRQGTDGTLRPWPLEFTGVFEPTAYGL